VSNSSESYLKSVEVGQLAASRLLRYVIFTACSMRIYWKVYDQWEEYYFWQIHRLV